MFNYVNQTLYFTSKLTLLEVSSSVQIQFPMCLEKVHWLKVFSIEIKFLRVLMVEFQKGR